LICGPLIRPQSGLFTHKVTHRFQRFLAVRCCLWATFNALAGAVCLRYATTYWPKHRKEWSTPETLHRGFSSTERNLPDVPLRTRTLFTATTSSRRFARLSALTANIAVGAETSRQKLFKIPFDRDSCQFPICRAECTAHISTRRVTTIYIGLFFGCIGAKSFLLY